MMRRAFSGIVVVGLQVLVVSFFCVITFKEKDSFDEKVSVVHNGNLNKIATSVSLRFEGDQVGIKKKIDKDFFVELPAINVIKEEKIVKKDKKVKKVKSVPLISVDSSKYVNKEDMGFKVTEGNKQYNLDNEYEFNVVVAVVAAEYDKNLNDALAVMSVILNRCDSKEWQGESPYSQVIRKGQFSVYLEGIYRKYMPGGQEFGLTKYNVAKQAVIDGLNGIRNNKYLGFRASWVTEYSDKYIVEGGNRYGYN